MDQWPLYRVVGLADVEREPLCYVDSVVRFAGRFGHLAIPQLEVRVADFSGLCRSGRAERLHLQRHHQTVGLPLASYA